jgi:hypothetical protein
VNAEKMTVREKVVGGMINSVSLYSAAGWFTAAGWGSCGTAAPTMEPIPAPLASGSAQRPPRRLRGVFSSSLFAPLFHEDPRYYAMGPGHGFQARFHGNRAIITRNRQRP